MKEKEYIEELKDKYGITEFGLPKELEGEEPDEVQEIFLSSLHRNLSKHCQKIRCHGNVDGTFTGIIM